MASIQSSRLFYSSRRTERRGGVNIISGAINIPRFSKPNIILSIPHLPSQIELPTPFKPLPTTSVIENRPNSPKKHAIISPDFEVISKLHLIREAISDRIEMHKNVGEQRNNWNTLLLTSINSLILAAATMAAMAATGGAIGGALGALKLSSTTLYVAATGLLLVMNKIQPSQLAEEQRNAARLFKHLHNQIQTTISIGNPTEHDVEEMMDRVLALDQAYPLPLLGAMLEKFPSEVEPAVWWPRPRRGREQRRDGNGWDGSLEGRMKQIVGVIRKNDRADYFRLGEKALKLNRVLAISGPALTGLAALGAAFVGSPSQGSWAAMLGVVAGALAAVVNTFEHGAQVGMVFEMYRSNAGFFKLVEDTIEWSLEEADMGRRENGDLLEMKVALQLGRSLSELRNLADSAATKSGEIDEFASKLF